MSRGLYPRWRCENCNNVPARPIDRFSMVLCQSCLEKVVRATVRLDFSRQDVKPIWDEDEATAHWTRTLWSEKNYAMVGWRSP